MPNIQLAAALSTARTWETVCHQASNIAGGEEKSSVNLVQHRFTSAMHVVDLGTLYMTVCPERALGSMLQ